MSQPKSVRTLGPTGLRVANNVKRLRGQTSLRELSERLESLGQTVHPSAITRVEQGDRRVDVDDLVALALALGVTPNRLLLDPEADGGELALTSQRTVTRWQAWEWELAPPRSRLRTTPVELGFRCPR